MQDIYRWYQQQEGPDDDHYVGLSHEPCPSCGGYCGLYTSSMESAEDGWVEVCECPECEEEFRVKVIVTGFDPIRDDVIVETSYV